MGAHVCEIAQATASARHGVAADREFSDHVGQQAECVSRYFALQLRHAFVAVGHLHSRGPGITGTFGPEHDDDLYPRPISRCQRCSQPIGFPGVGPTALLIDSFAASVWMSAQGRDRSIAKSWLLARTIGPLHAPSERSARAQTEVGDHGGLHCLNKKIGNEHARVTSSSCQRRFRAPDALYRRGCPSLAQWCEILRGGHLA